MEIVLAIDGGGSRTRCLAVDRSGYVLGQGESGPSNHLLVHSEIVTQSLEEAIEEALEQALVDRRSVVCVSAGLAGVDYDGTGSIEMEQVLRSFGFERLVVNGDMVIAHAGALRLRPGVVALAGTGSVVLGVGRNDERVKVGGWGPIFGDEGSAYRIGEQSLRAAARAHDGRGPATALEQSILAALGIADFRDALHRVYVKGMEPREIAALSRVAYEAAEAGDPVARQIFLQAGTDLAESVSAAISQLDLGYEVFVSYQGSVLDSCRILREQFEQELRMRVENARVVAPEFEPVMGAYLLGCQNVGWISSEKIKGSSTS